MHFEGIGSFDFDEAFGEQNLLWSTRVGTRSRSLGAIEEVGFRQLR